LHVVVLRHQGVDLDILAQSAPQGALQKAVIERQGMIHGDRLLDDRF
jgi:hypothetical protein